MSKITVTTIAGLTSGGDANKVKIESGDTLQVESNATVGGTLGVTGAMTGTTQTLNRSGNGVIQTFQKDGSTIGQISGTIGLIVGTGDTGLGFQTSTGDAIIPQRPDTQAGADNLLSFGNTSYRFKDIYLGGGIYLGGTVAANKLDDYEEGTWTPTAGTNSGSFDSGTKKGRYTKIGDMVFILAFVQFTGASTNANRTIGGLPFTVQDVSGLTGVDYFGHSWNGNHYGLVQFAGGGTDLVDNYSAILAGSFASSGTTRLYGWYKTSS